MYSMVRVPSKSSESIKLRNHGVVVRDIVFDIGRDFSVFMVFRASKVLGLSVVVSS